MFSASTSTAPLSPSSLLKLNPLSALRAQMGTIVTSEITPRVFVADWFVAQNSLDVTHVVSVCEIPPIVSSKIAHMHVCIIDLPIADISDHFEKTTKFIRDALAQEGAEVLVCHLLELPLIARKLMRILVLVSRSTAWEA
jgi:hypothetical protein